MFGVPYRLTSESRDFFAKAIERVKADTPSRWGEMNAVRMLRHLRVALEAARHTDDPRPDFSMPAWKRLLMRVLFFDLPMPWPKGKIKVPDELTPEPENDFETEKSLLIEALDTFLELASEHPDTTLRHPVVGDVSLRYWRRIHARHMQHHLAQFGAV
jgi:hypothetical protein